MISFLTTKVLGYAAGVLAIALAATLLWSYTQGVRIDGLNADLKACRADVTAEQNRVKQCQADIRTWQGKVNEQNAAIQKMREEALARAQEAARLLARARAAAVTAEARAKELEARLAAPTPPGADCKTAIEEVRSGLDLQ